jgi:hypothetical protein
MSLRFLWRGLKIGVISILCLIVTAVVVAVSFNVNQSRKRSETIRIDIVFTQGGCEESCNDYKVKSVDSSQYKWLVGKVVDIEQYSDVYKKGLPGKWYDSGFDVFCVTGKLHRAKAAFFWFWPRGEVYKFTGYDVKPGMCNNPKAKQFKG